MREESSNEKKYYVLELKAKSSKVTYGKVILWVEQKNFWPLKAEFYGVSGRFLKICSYENYKMLAGKMRPSRLVLSDAVIDGQYSVIEYDKIEVGRIENKYFTREYLKKWFIDAILLDTFYSFIVLSNAAAWAQLDVKTFDSLPREQVIAQTLEFFRLKNLRVNSREIVKSIMF